MIMHSQVLDADVHVSWTEMLDYAIDRRFIDVIKFRVTRLVAVSCYPLAV